MQRSHLSNLLSILASVGLLICLLTLSFSNATAYTWHVPAEVPTIQAGIDAAAAGDTVLIAYGTYTGDGNRDIDFLGKAICVRSESGIPASCVVYCQASVSDQHRGFVFQSGESAESRLEGISIVQGYVENLDDPYPEGEGGGIIVLGESSPTLRSLILQNNTAMVGGGMYVDIDCSPTITDCVFVGNSAWWGSGGGICSVGSTIQVTDCIFRENTTHQTGGGVSLHSTQSFFEHCEFYDNSVQYGAVQYGGGLYCSGSGSECELIGCTFAGNWANSGGGVYVMWSSSCTFRNCTLVDNAASYGGGIYVDNSAAVLHNSIIAFSSQGSAVKCVYEASVGANCCDFFGNAGGDWVDCVAGMDGITGNISADPLFCGDENPTAPYTLAAGSPCGPDQYPCSLMGAWPTGCGATSVDSSPQIRPVLVLHQATPNPFNPQTTIGFDLPEQTTVSLSIYDLSGRLVKVLVGEESYAAGPHSVVWRGKDERGESMPSGTYVIRLRTEDGVETKKMMLVR